MVDIMARNINFQFLRFVSSIELCVFLVNSKRYDVLCGLPILWNAGKTYR